MAKRVVIASHFPPPVTGMSAVNDRIATVLRSYGAVVSRLSMTSSKPLAGPRKLLSRLSRLLFALGSLVLVRGQGAKAFYMPLDAHSGLIANILLGIVASGLRFRVYVHHHSFAYIERRSVLMAALMRQLPRGTVHAFLCAEMQDRFYARYKHEWTARDHVAAIVPNGFMQLPSAANRRRTSDSALVLGHLSNLSRAKGTFVFLDMFERLAETTSQLQAIVAGPAVDAEVIERLETLQQEHGDRFRWIGPVYGDQKDAFFESIDLFVFPTEYVNEAQPLVLVEALAHGVPVVATRRGCIECDHSPDISIVADAEDLAPAVAKLLEEILEDREILRRMSMRARDYASTHANAAREQLGAFLGSMIN